ncbi:hypothetical protein SAMN02745885_02396 [Carboxydocella sporoproducens DSM 16521]|uniref:Uncharacterized protein n=2 Tax=Carboxydocella TaxID=178898 RepID=A0A1T4S2B3_9FIRM|nr:MULTISPECIES: hypothetical protein [Carboxydocella]GAW32814.1 hypothetical protein JDF658_25790 [Carboxydocella sp. JDF658]AVX20675.1 hypothetical protein CFE_1486 [Carboxydocella thermautotrophica]AVX31095.1 hypothetical protein CTH_1505 [Carboxydocella thermautotrophica]SKA22373.1 hypothetical protein SAMN02745885_02396 [Carboxydocella sporoproducens DSM 16521]GAW28207.1 hypothetical protein ULO1_07770 [Carboxydocella sp. ULO1]
MHKNIKRIRIRAVRKQNFVRREIDENYYVTDDYFADGRGEF